MNIGLSRHDATPVNRTVHIRQAVADVLTTPIGSRVMRRWFGSYMAALVDAPGNPRGKLKAIAAVADALARCEPRVKMLSGRVDVTADGKARLCVSLKILPTGDVTEVRL